MTNKTKGRDISTMTDQADRCEEQSAGESGLLKLYLEEVSARRSKTGHDELYLMIDGKRMAYRGHPRTKDAGKWVSMYPSFKVVEEHPDDGVPVLDAGEIGFFPEPKGQETLKPGGD